MFGQLGETTPVTLSKPSQPLNQYQPRYPTNSADCATSQDYGVSSAMQELMGVVTESAELGIELRSALGISIPKDPHDTAEQFSSVVGALRWVASTLRNANADVTDSIRHLRS